MPAQSHFSHIYMTYVSEINTGRPEIKEKSLQAPLLEQCRVFNFNTV
jgi:hypothetical protein